MYCNFIASDASKYRFFSGFVSLVVFVKVLQDEDVCRKQILAGRHF